MRRQRATELARESGFGRRGPMINPISRRSFLAGAAGASATLMAGSLAGIGSSLVRAAPPFSGPDASAPWFEKSIPELQALMSSGQMSSRELTKAYLSRIARLNPTLGAVIETNPQAIGIAARLDGERRAGRVRSPLHGIPILLKDNIATDDAMQTTAGSLALMGTGPGGCHARAQPAPRRRRGAGQDKPVRMGELPRISAG